MNAYELADEIDSIAKDWLGQNKSGQLANVLRQQADRIAELEKELAFMEGEYPEPTIAAKIKEFANLEQAYNRVAELEKQCEALADEYAIQVNEVCKLTYEIEQLTPQTKLLSNNEIQEIYSKNFDIPHNLLGFARAIEAKVRGKNNV